MSRVLPVDLDIGEKRRARSQRGHCSFSLHVLFPTVATSDVDREAFSSYIFPRCSGVHMLVSWCSRFGFLFESDDRITHLPPALLALSSLTEISVVARTHPAVKRRLRTSCS